MIGREYSTRKSPRTRRLEADYRAIQKLAAESSIFRFQALGPIPESYRFIFHGPGTWRTPRHTVAIRDHHEIVVELGAAYPRMMPSLNWQTPVFHPNVSSSGIVCLGGYGTHWVPSLRLDELAVMLWDMIRYRNFDVLSPYNREAALWARDQVDFRLPLDDRPLRDRVSAMADAPPVEAAIGAPPIVLEKHSAPASGNGAMNPVEAMAAKEAQALGNHPCDIFFLDR
jgi:ubiquitin-protein ligase